MVKATVKEKGAGRARGKRVLKDEILKAAIALVEERGAGALTLDAVAKRAGVSKGGLIHHFNTKEALLTELIAGVTATFEKERRASVESLEKFGAETADMEVKLMKTYLERAFKGLGRDNNGAMALFAVATHQPDLLQPIRDYFASREEEALQFSRSPLTVLMISLLADGLWLFDALGIPPFSEKVRKEIGELAKEWSERAIREGEVVE